MKDTGAEYFHFRLMPSRVPPARSPRGRSVLDGWQLDGLTDDVVTCVSELVANVHEHAANSAIAELFLLWVPAPLLERRGSRPDPRMPRRLPATNLRVPPFALIDPANDELEIMQLAEAAGASPWWRPSAIACGGDRTATAARWSAATAAQGRYRHRSQSS